MLTPFLRADLTLYAAGRQFFRDALGLDLDSPTEQGLDPADLLAGTTAALSAPARAALALVGPAGVYYLGQLDTGALRRGATSQASLGFGLAPTFDEVKKSPARYEGIAVLATDLAARPTRAQAAELARAFNRAATHLPVLLLLRHPAEADGPALKGRAPEQAPPAVRLTLAATERVPYARAAKAGEKVVKVSVLYDIDVAHPHAGHQRILTDLRPGAEVQSLEELYRAWNRVLSIQELNKRFYRELSSWYFWAVREVRFPTYPGALPDDERHATAVIRLITRVIFVWFLREKKLVPEVFFAEDANTRLYDPAADPHPASKTDPRKSTYYKAILQNLFFATLNTERTDKDGKPVRDWRPEERSARNHNEAYAEPSWLRFRGCFRDPDAALALFREVPFLNGGLFECLDGDGGDAGRGKKAERALPDCFSEGHQARLVVPDELFFGSAREVDLSQTYGGDRRFARERVKGLIGLLNGYKFTVAENTPLEEEVALDPELLGRVFENLLAAYNPETQTTARKLTGSFYTPREVVEYMVDESLVTYLAPFVPDPAAPRPPAPARRLAQAVDQPNQNLFGEVKPQQAALALLPAADGPALKGRATEPESDTAAPTLRALLRGPAAAPNPFDAATTARLIQALNALKLLDPACGSGAFPMGALQRLVHLLTILDPNNKLWKATQLANAETDKQAARRFQDPTLREKALLDADERIADIKKSFDSTHHELDYARKLYLIENCLYGVDIQPVAAQITKLRCFITLLVDQRPDRAEPRNFGIRPLPNLETHFVVANTLLRLPQQQTFETEKLTDLKEELAQLRHEYFTVKSRQKKKALRERDTELRGAIAAELENAGSFDHQTAERLAKWDPYKLGESAQFFQADWMLGVTNGFHIVTGNPPWGVSYTSEEKAVLQRQFTTVGGRAESYVAFIERSLQLLQGGGVLSFIVPDTYLNLDFTQPLREHLLGVSQIQEVVTLPSGVFEAAVVDSALLLTTKTERKRLTGKAPVSVKRFYKKAAEFLMDAPDRAYLVDAATWRSAERFTLSDPEETRLMKQLLDGSKALSEFATGVSGIKAYEVGKGNPAQTAATLSSKPFTSTSRENKKWLPFYEGKHISRFSNDWKSNSWIFYGEWLAAPRRKENFTGEKILIRKIVSDTLQATYLNEDSFCNTLLFVVKLRPGAPFSYPFALALINSRLMAWVIRQTLEIDVTDTFPQIMLNNVLSLPIRVPSVKSEKKIVDLVNKTLVAKTAGEDIGDLCAQIDALIYQLYNLTPAEIQLIEGGTPAPATADDDAAPTP